MDTHPSSLLRPTLAQPVRATRAHRARLSLGSLWLLSTSVLGCAATAPVQECKKPEIVLLELDAAPQLNRDEDGSPRSVMLRVYQLAQSDSFERASFDELWQSDPKQLLGEALLSGPDETLLIPGRRLILSLKRHPDTQLVAITGKFRSREGSWRTLAALPAALDPCSREAERSPTRVRVHAVESDLRPDFGGRP